MIFPQISVTIYRGLDPLNLDSEMAKINNHYASRRRYDEILPN